jgi:hypothetical protein
MAKPSAQEKSERAAPGLGVLGCSQASRSCPICGTPHRSRQRTARPMPGREPAAEGEGPTSAGPATPEPPLSRRADCRLNEADRGEAAGYAGGNPGR